MRSLERVNIRTNVRTHIRTGQTLYPLHNFVVRGDKKGKTVGKRSVKPQNCEKCKFKCNTKFTEVERAQIFQTYYSLETYDRQRRFICDMILKVTQHKK